MIAIALAALLAQVTPVQPIVKGTGLAMQDDGEAAVLATVDALFAGLEASDAAAIRARLRLDGGATVAAVRPDGTHQVRHLSWDEWLAGIKPDGHHYRERFTGRPAVEVDGDIAMVWGEFTLSVDGAVRDCGVDHVDLVRENGAWKVQNVTWSQRTTGCAA